MGSQKQANYKMLFNFYFIMAFYFSRTMERKHEWVIFHFNMYLAGIQDTSIN